MPPRYAPGYGPADLFSRGFGQGLNLYQLYQQAQGAQEDRDIKRQGLLEKMRQEQADQDYRQNTLEEMRLKNKRDEVFGWINAGQWQLAEKAVNNDPDLRDRYGEVKLNPKESIGSAGGLVYRIRPNPEAGKPDFDVLYDPGKKSTIESQRVGAYEALGRGELLPQFRTLEEQRDWALGLKATAENVPNMGAYQTFVATKGRVRPPGVPEGISVGEAEATLKGMREQGQQRIDISREGLDLREQRQRRIPDLDRRQVGEIDTGLQQMDAVEKAYKETPAFKTGSVSDTLKSAIATNNTARSLDAMGLLPTGGLTAEEKNFASEYNALLLRLRRLSGDPRFSDQDAARTMQALGSGALGKEFPAQLQASKRFLERERLNLLRGLQGAGFEVGEFEKAISQVPEAQPQPSGTGRSATGGGRVLRFDAQGNQIP